jgi:hypothetical protein
MIIKDSNEGTIDAELERRKKKNIRKSGNMNKKIKEMP